MSKTLCCSLWSSQEKAAVNLPLLRHLLPHPAPVVRTSNPTVTQIMLLLFLMVVSSTLLINAISSLCLLVVKGPLAGFSTLPPKIHGKQWEHPQPGNVGMGRSGEAGPRGGISLKSVAPTFRCLLLHPTHMARATATTASSRITS